VAVAGMDCGGYCGHFEMRYDGVWMSTDEIMVKTLPLLTAKTADCQLPHAGSVAGGIRECRLLHCCSLIFITATVATATATHPQSIHPQPQPLPVTQPLPVPLSVPLPVTQPQPQPQPGLRTWWHSCHTSHTCACFRMARGTLPAALSVPLPLPHSATLPTTMLPLPGSATVICHCHSHLPLPLLDATVFAAKLPLPLPCCHFLSICSADSLNYTRILYLSHVKMTAMTSGIRSRYCHATTAIMCATATRTLTLPYIHCHCHRFFNIILILKKKKKNH
jgi:hypothetical protein